MALSRVKKRQGIRSLQWKIIFKLSLFLIFVSLSLVFTNKLKESKFFPIKNVEIMGVHKADHSEIQQILKSLVDNGFFSVDVELVKDRLLQSPWINRVAVQRLWPDRVVITIEEKSPVALWNNGALLSLNGDLFTPSKESYPTDLPSFIGPEGEQITMLQQYNKINNSLTPLHFKISRLELCATSAWRIVLDNGIKITLGVQDILGRINHLVKVYPKIIGDRSSEVDSIDLRYSNGLAIKWKTVEK